MSPEASQVLRSRVALTMAGQYGCVANPPELVPRRGRLVPRTAVYGDAYRGYDHRRCAHPTPIPAGTRRCPGDPGCETRLPTGTVGTCGYHRDWGTATGGHAWNVLMGSPHRADGLAE